MYSRSSIPTKAVKYAINLLNQNIAQLSYEITGKRCDIRCTIDNLLHIFQMFVEIEQNKREIHSHIRTLPQKRLTINEITSEFDGQTNDKQERHFTHNGKDYSLSKSHSSVDMNHMPPPPLPNILHHNIKDFPLTNENVRFPLNLNSQPVDINMQGSGVTQNNQKR